MGESIDFPFHDRRFPLSLRRCSSLNLSYRDPARDSDNAPDGFSSRRNACYRLYHAHYIMYIKPQSGRSARGGWGFDSRGATGDFVTRSYSWSILGVTSSLDYGDRLPRVYLWIEFARFPGKLVFLFLPFLSPATARYVPLVFVVTVGRPVHYDTTVRSSAGT